MEDKSSKSAASKPYNSHRYKTKHPPVNQLNVTAPIKFSDFSGMAV